MKLQPGDIFDEFEVVEHIGTGAFSEVFLGYDTILDRMVVLKQLSPDLSSDDQEWDAFVNEAQTTASFFHPGIVTIHALRIDKFANSAILVLEYMDGGTLYDMIRREGALDLDTLWRLAYQIGNALGYIHQRGIVHRDIKPQNILFSKETSWFKLSDFGLVYNPERPEFEEINHGQPGTLIYMSPEQTRHITPLTERSDVYTFAVVLYEGLTGRYYLPIDLDEATPEEIEYAIQKEDPIPLPQFYENLGIVAQMEKVLFRALAKKPNRRYPTVRRLVSAFTRVIEAIQVEQSELNASAENGS